MRMALRIARRGRGRVEPDPMVGCVLVQGAFTIGTRVIGRGYHHAFGGPHAEVAAIASCTESPRGATAYVTLEPCCHVGKTGPCAEALIAAGVARVVAAIEDPNPLVAGGGLRRLRAAGVEVVPGVCADEAEALAAPFLKHVRTGRPWVIAKWAQSLDGKLATHTGDSKWITDERMRAHAHRMRGRVDAVMVGVNTVVRDDPLLTARHGRPRRIPTRVVLDTNLRTSVGAQLVRTAAQAPTWLFCSQQAPAAEEAALTSAGCRVIRVPLEGDRINLGAVLDHLGAAGMSNVIVEGGGMLLGSFLDARLVDEVHAYISPLLIGGDNAPGVWRGPGVPRVSEGVRFGRECTGMKLGAGWMIGFRIRHQFGKAAADYAEKRG